MTRLTLRQFRTEAVVSFGLLVGLAIVLALTGPHLAQVNDAFQRACKAAQDCATAPNPMFQVDPALRGFLPFIVTVTPAIIGIFLGAPLVARELETGTFRLVWTQSVTRRRWLAVKLGVVGLAAMLLGALVTWMADWWLSPIDAANRDRFDPANFGVHGVAPIGYAAFAFALGVAAGVLLRRTVPAMAAMLVGFVAARLVVEYWVRPHLAAPLHKSLPVALSLSASAGTSSLAAHVTMPNDLVLSTAVVNKSGHAVTIQSLLHGCLAYGQPPHPCITKLGLHAVVTYQPGSRFWLFQWGELGIFFAAALAVCGLTYWLVRHRYG
jgi:hypothetical protein